MINKITYFSLILFVLSCNINDKTRTYKLPKTIIQETIAKESFNMNESEGLKWEKPNSWVPSNGSAMRSASFSVPFSEGTGDLSVIQLGGTGGGLEPNVNRWRRQLNLEPLTINEIEKIIIKQAGKLGVYNMLHIVDDKMNNAFLCAIISTDDVTIFVKLSLNPNGISEIKDDFIAFCSSLNFLK